MNATIMTGNSSREQEVRMRRKPIKIRHPRKWTVKICLLLVFMLAVFLYQGGTGPKEAEAAVTLRICGAVASNAAAITPAPDATHQAGDVELLFIETANEASSLATAAGFVELTNIGVGTAAGADGTRLTVFWRRWNGADGSPTTNDSGDHQAGVICSYSGVITSGNPWDVFGTSSQTPATTNGSVNAVSTTVTDTLIVIATAGSLPDSNTTTEFSGWTNANLGSLTERFDVSRNAGNGGSLGVADGTKATAGSTGATTFTTATSATKANIHIALKPQPPDVTAPTVGTVTASNTVVGNYVDGTFDLSATLSDNESTVTSCQYCAASDGTCDTEWAAGTLSGSSPTWTCTVTGITGFANGTALTLNIRGVSGGGTGTGTPITKTVDSAGPASGASFSATPADASCTLNWASTTDAGSGLHATQPYEVRWQLGSDPGSCTGGAQLYIGTGTSAPHGSLANGNTYYYRLCYKDALNNQSQYSANPITCVPSAATPTRFYFPATTASDVNPPFATWTYTSEAVRGKLSQSKGTSTITIGTQVGPWTAGTTALDRQYISDPLAAQTISGTVKAYLMAMEYAGTDNATSRLKVYVVSNDGQTVRGTLLNLNQYGPATEYNNAHRNKAFADGDTAGSVTAQFGDRLVVEIGHSDAAGTTPEASIKWGENAADCAENETGLTDCAGWIEFSSSITLLPAGATLMHNSTSTGSTKWGGWGVAGKRYGEITCETCHVKTSAGIKRIKDTVIASPNTPTNRFPAEIGGIAPVFSRVSGVAGQAGVMGDDSLTPRASSNKICEVCHTYDAAGTNGVKLHPYSVGVAINNPGHQNNAKDCMGCHKHNQGFKAPGCDTCHGNPPTTATFGGPTGLSDPDRTGSTTAGAHNAHAVTLAFSCEACHFGYAMPENPGGNPQTIDIGFSMWTKNGTGTSYGAANEVRVTDAYRGTNSTTIVNDNTRNCSGLYCHGSTLTAGSDPIPAWTDASAACGTCHGAAPATPPTAGSHQRHSGSGVYTGKQGISVACSDCHGAHTAGDGHVNGSVSWLLNTGSIKFGANAKYNTLAAGSTGAVAPSASYQTCTNLYCHSSVQSNPGTGAPAAYDSPTWGAASVTCDSCHGQGTGVNNGSPSTGSHEVHVTTYAYACSVCHSGLGDEVASHANGTIDLAFDAATAGGSAAYSRTNSITPQSGSFGTCATTFCHGDSSNTSADAGTWGTSLSAADACTVCHGTKTTAADGGAAVINRAPGGNGTGVDTAGQTGTPFTSNVSGDAQVGAHDVHLRALNAYSNPISCDQCHAVPAVSVAGIKGHLDGTPATMTWGTLATNAGAVTPTYVTGGGACSNYCHGANLADGSPATKATPDWNTSMLAGTGSTDCGKCHGNPPNTSDHGGVNANVCSSCHPHVVDSATASPFFQTSGSYSLASHINGVKDATGGDCLGCHSSQKGTSPNIRAKIFGSTLGTEGDDFVRPSRHVKNSTVKNVDCIICHAEGDTGSTEAGVIRSTLHANSTIDLRNVDQAAAPGANGTAGTNYYQWPGWRLKAYTATTTDRNNLDTFCMNCHDSDTSSSTATRGGSYSIAVNATSTGLLVGGPVTRRTTPFNHLDGGSPLDVRGQFNRANTAGSGYASHHQLAQFTPRYTASYQTTYSTRGGWTGTSKDGVAMKWDTLLHCSDCHLNEANAHGARAATRMLQDSSGGDTAAVNAGGGTGTFVCYKCHLSTVYNSGSTDTRARITHGSLDPVPWGAGSYGDRGIVCMNCHSGAAIGGIHGNNRSITTTSQGATKSYRFIYGNELGLNISEANWSTTTQPSCYTSGTTWGGSCTKHNGATAETGRIGAPNYSRALQ